MKIRLLLVISCLGFAIVFIFFWNKKISRPIADQAQEVFTKEKKNNLLVPRPWLDHSPEPQIETTVKDEKKGRQPKRFSAGDIYAMEDYIFSISKRGEDASESADDIIPFLQSGEPKLESMAAFAVSKMSGDVIDKAMPLLTKLLQSPDEETKRNALFAISKASEHTEEVVLEVAHLLDDRSEEVVTDALYTLSRAGSNAVPVLKKIQPLLHHRSPSMREEAAFTIGRMGPDAHPVRDILATMVAKDKNAKVKEAAANAIRIIEGGAILREPK